MHRLTTKGRWHRWSFRHRREKEPNFNFTLLKVSSSRFHVLFFVQVHPPSGVSAGKKKKKARLQAACRPVRSRPVAGNFFRSSRRPCAAPSSSKGTPWRSICWAWIERIPGERFKELSPFYAKVLPRDVRTLTFRQLGFTLNR